MAGRREVSIILKARDEASKVIDNLTTGSLLRMVKGVGAAVGAFASFYTVQRVLRASVAASAEAQVANQRLAQAVIQSGQSWETQGKAISSLADKYQDLTGISDDLIRANTAQLVSLGKLKGEGLDRAIAASIDFGQFLGDHKTAFDLVAKAAGGYTSALSRYGITIDDSLPKSERFAAVLTGMERAFGGQAQAFLKTYEGRVLALSNRWNDFLEKLGDTITTSPAVLAALEGLADILKSMTEELETGKAREGIKDVVVALLGIADAAILATRVLHVFAGTTTSLLKDVFKGGEDDKLFGNMRAFFAEDGPKIDAQLQQLAARLNELRVKVSGVSTEPSKAGEGLKRMGEAGADAAEKLDAKLVKALEKIKKLSVAIEERVALGPLQLALDEIGIAIDKNLNEKARNAERAWTFLQQAMARGEISQERFEAISKELEEIVKGLREAGIVVNGLGEHVEVTTGEFISMGEAVRSLVEEGLDVFLLRLAESRDEIRSLGEEIRVTLREIGVDSAVQFTDTLVDGALGAKIRWREFMRQLLADLLKAIARALVLRAVLGIATGGGSETLSLIGVPTGGGTIGAQLGGIMPQRWQHARRFAMGGIGVVPGGGYRDTIPALLQPRELVVPAAASREILAGRASLVGRGGGGAHVEIHETNHFHAPDSDAVYRLFVRNGHSIERAFRTLRSRGYAVGFGG